VSDALVVGIFSKDLGYDLLRGFIVPQPGAAEEISADSVLEFMEDKVSDAKQLKAGILFVSAVPRDPYGKLRRDKVPDAALVIKA
jgi:4-coumarate--CoA ligase